MSGMQTVVSAIRQARASLALTVARAKVLLSSEKVLAQLGARSESESKISPRRSKSSRCAGDAPRLQRARTHQPCGRSRAVLCCCSETTLRPSCAVCLVKILIRQDITQYVQSGGITTGRSRCGPRSRYRSRRYLVDASGQAAAICDRCRLILRDVNLLSCDPHMRPEVSTPGS
jgi:hypothetical protein